MKQKFDIIESTCVPLPLENIDTDQIIPARFLKATDKEGFGDNLFRDWRFNADGSPKDFVLNDPTYSGEVLVAGKNFGCGSSREQAPEIIKALGIKAVVARSFARIFYRNSINNGLLLIENPDLRDDVTEGDTIEVAVGEKITLNGKEYPIASLPENLLEILNAGGLVKAMRKRNGLED